MKKILSLGTKEIMSGISQDEQIVSGGIWYTADGLNPYVSRSLGAITFTQAPTEIGSIDGDATSMTFDGTNLYTFTNSGAMYKVSSSFGNPSISNIRAAASISSPAVGMELYQTLTGSKYLYYWQAGQIGRYDLVNTFDDDWNTTITSSATHPTLRIDDRIFFGSGNYVEYLYDNGTNPGVTTTAFDLPKEYTITSLATDGEYLIVGASKNAGVFNSYNETAIVYWDWKNTLPSWTKIHYITDEKIYSIQTVAGVQYALGSRGTYVFNISTPPKLIRKDVIASTGYPQIGGTYNDALTFGTGVKIGFYGKTVPNVDTAYFKPIVDPGNKTIDCIRTDVSASRIFYASDKLYYVNPQTASTSYGGLLLSSLSTAYINLGGLYKIDRIEFVFSGLLASGDLLSTPTLYGHGGNDLSVAFTNVGYTINGAVGSAVSVPVSESFVGDELQLDISSMTGSFKIKRIDFYGEAINR